MKNDKVKEYLTSEEGARNANRFIDAAKENRILIALKKPWNGKSIQVSVHEITKNFGILQFDWFVQNLGWSHNRQGHIIVSGGGMDLTFHLTYSILNTLRCYGFDVPERLEYKQFNYI